MNVVIVESTGASHWIQPAQLLLAAAFLSAAAGRARWVSGGVGVDPRPARRACVSVALGTIALFTLLFVDAGPRFGPGIAELLFGSLVMSATSATLLILFVELGTRRLQPVRSRGWLGAGSALCLGIFLANPFANRGNKWATIEARDIAFGAAVLAISFLWWSLLPHPGSDLRRTFE